MAPARTRRPFIFVLAGVNGAGKSSVGGAMLAEHGLSWFNPDTYARQLAGQLGLDAAQANGRAWEYGRTRLEAAIGKASNYAFETTLGARTIPQLLAQAAPTHDVMMWFCGLSSAEHHIARVQLRVAHGGHPIPTEKIHERWTASRLNLIRLLPVLARLQVFDNSTDAAPGTQIPAPRLVMETLGGKLAFPAMDDTASQAATPAWARPILQAAIEQS
ncbi:AAA family ATPase [Bordetella sp. BOR01]|uniref:AAA family ATPase n=1 Tax=Bordetella sp. BOR01 TaxID=2854779 RepID=UPI001C47198E|nr:AAA family ATPase [Bordetella sp. BOR01]MBV7482099.1 hypothetical protein [Bordetella sp. BOR01]